MIPLNRPACPYPQALASSNYKHPKNKKALVDATAGKCMYCETKITHSNFGHVEHIKPKAQGLFPELEFNWDNLGYVCDRCNVAKSNKWFPQSPLIDPFNEDPSTLIDALGPMLLPLKASERGEITINEIHLNRPDLIERRAARLKVISASYSAAKRTMNEALKASALTEIRREASTDAEFSFVVRRLLEYLDNTI